MTTRFLDQLLVGLGYDYDDKEVKQFKEDMMSVTKVVAALTTAAVATAGALTKITLESTETTDELTKLGKEVGLSAGLIEALEFGLSKAGGEASALGSSLQGLSKASSEAVRGLGSGLEAFGLLGISVQNANGVLKNNLQLMLEVSGALQGLEKQRQIELAEKLGLSGSIRLLQLGPQAIRDYIEEAEQLGLTTSEDSAIAEEFRDSLVDVNQILKSVSRTISREVAPFLSDLVQNVKEWWIANRQLVIQNIPKWIDALTLTLKALSTVLAGLIALQFWKLFASWPLLIALVVAAFGLLVQDAQGFFKGHDSFLGDLLKKYPEWEKSIMAIAKVFNFIADTIEMIVFGWKEIFKLANQFTAENIKEVAGNIPGFLGSLVGLDDFIKARQERVFDPATGSFRDATQMRIEKLEVNVNGAGSPEAVGQAVVNQFQQTAQDLVTAVEQ